MAGECTDSRGTVAELRALLNKATPGPWKADLDKFDADDIHACVTDEDIELLATIATGCNFYQPNEYESYTPKMKADQDAAWAKAKESQALRDAALIAALRNAAPKLLAVVEAAESFCAMAPPWGHAAGPARLEMLRDALRRLR